MGKSSYIFTGINAAIMAVTLMASPFAPPAVAQFLATTFNIANRTDVSFAAVGVVSPNTAGKNMAWDVVPGEGATPNSDSGYAWQDVCNINPITHPTSGIFCAREGIKDRSGKSATSASSARARSSHSTIRAAFPSMSPTTLLICASASLIGLRL